MEKTIKNLIYDLIPPIFLKFYRRVRRKYGFFGNYNSWDEAERNLLNYNREAILNKIKDSLLKVRAGKAAYERDSVLYERAQYPFPILAALLLIYISKGNRLSVLDFGGSLGSTYFSCKKFFNGFVDFNWSIVELEDFVTCGKKTFEDEQLKFYYSIDGCLLIENPDVIILSSVIQYIRDPYQFLEQIVKYNLKYIIFDRIPFFDNSKDCITIQKVSPEIYEANHVFYFLSFSKFMEIFENKYEVITDFDALDVYDLGYKTVKTKGYLLKRKL